MQSEIAIRQMPFSVPSTPSSGYFADFASGSFESRLRSRPKRPLRSQIAIAMAILEACRTPNVQHWIMVKARIGYGTFESHMRKLLDDGMMDTAKDGNKTLYKLNSKGLGFLNTHQNQMNII